MAIGKWKVEHRCIMSAVIVRVSKTGIIRLNEQGCSDIEHVEDGCFGV